MANLKETRGRIKSIKSTKKITKAMQMVATAKLKKIRDSLDSLKEYKSELNVIISNIINKLSESELKKFHSNPLILNNSPKEGAKSLIILNTSNKGLCGGINNYNIKKLNSKVQELQKRERDIIIYCIGKKGFDYCLSHYPQNLFNKQPVIVDEKTNFNLDEIKDEITNIILENNILSSFIIFSNFVNTTTQKAEEVSLTPIHYSTKSNFVHSSKYNIDAKAGKILERLLPEFMLCSILFTVFENSTSEQSARMIAMDNATNNATKAIQNLTLIYNRIRQANITREISEIVAGVESLKQS